MPRIQEPIVLWLVFLLSQMVQTPGHGQTGNQPREQRIGEIVIIGNESTPYGLIFEEAGLYPGTFLDQRDLRVAQEKIKKVGIFKDVSIQPTGDGREFRDILIRVVENERPGVADELKALDGNWIVEFANLNGVRRKTEAGGRLNFAKHEVTVQIGEDSARVFFVIEPKSRPKTIDLIFVIESKRDFARARGFYELDKGSLRVCWRQDGKTPFALDDKGQVLLTLRRKK